MACHMYTYSSRHMFEHMLGHMFICRVQAHKTTKKTSDCLTSIVASITGRSDLNLSCKHESDLLEDTPAREIQVKKLEMLSYDNTSTSERMHKVK